MYFEHAMGLEPCPLCMMQRLVVVALGCLFLGNAIFGSVKPLRLTLDGLVSATAAGGVFIAARHTWLQGLPADEVPACGPGLDYIMGTFPMLEGLLMILKGSGECAEVAWRFLGLSMPQWLIIVFLGFACLGIFNILVTLKKITIGEKALLAE